MRKILLTATIIALSSNGVANSKEKDEHFFNCQAVSNKEICEGYNRDFKIYLERKNNFKKNRVRYFFNPELLIDGFSTPLVFNLLLDDVFKNIHKENVSQVAISYSKKMAKMIDEYYKEKVEPQILKNENEVNSLFKNEIYYNNELFNRKLVILNWLFKDKVRLINYQKAYANNKGDLIENCIVDEYKELKARTWKTQLCRLT